MSTTNFVVLHIQCTFTCTTRPMYRKVKSLNASPSICVTVFTSGRSSLSNILFKYFHIYHIICTWETEGMREWRYGIKETRIVFSEYQIKTTIFVTTPFQMLEPYIRWNANIWLQFKLIYFCESHRIVMISNETLKCIPIIMQAQKGRTTTEHRLIWAIRCVLWVLKNYDAN